MKKLMFTAAAVFATVNLFAQGTVIVQNDATTLIRNILTGASALAGTTFRVALYWAPEGVTDPGQFRLVPTPVNIAPVAGRYSAGTRLVPADDPLTTVKEGIPPGGMAMLQVRAWEAAFALVGGADSYEAAFNAPYNDTLGRRALVGASNMFLADTADPAVPTDTPRAITAMGLQGFTLTVVPEPSAVGLGLIGIGALLLLRRRK